jgi:hypothetical protein
MAIELTKLRPSALCRLLNSTLLGEVINSRRLQRQRERTGLRFGSDRHVDFFKYFAWLFQERHAPKPPRVGATPGFDAAEAAQATVEFVCRQRQSPDHHLTRRQQRLIEALLTEPTYAKAAKQAGVPRSTLYRWLSLPDFQEVLRQARRALYDASIARLQAWSGSFVNTIIEVAEHGRRESDRLRACFGALDRGASLPTVNLGHDCSSEVDSLQETGGASELLEVQLQQVCESDLSISEKVKLTTKLISVWLRAHKQDEEAQRMEALIAVLEARKENS